MLAGVRAALDSMKGWLNAAVGFLYPEVCQLCGNSHALPEDGYVCGKCSSTARFIQPPFCDRCGMPSQGAITNRFECANCRELDFDFCSARSAVEARGGVLEAIHRYKYSRALWFEPFLARLLVRQAVPELARQSWDLIAPVPLHASKRREREFNQAERLAARLSRATGLPVNNRLLCRVLPTRTQTLLSRPERMANVRDAFALRPRTKVDGKRIVLIDDVFTTGATTSACASVLREAGAGEVCVWTVARGV